MTAAGERVYAGGFERQTFANGSPTQHVFSVSNGVEVVAQVKATVGGSHSTAYTHASRMGTVGIVEQGTTVTETVHDAFGKPISTTGTTNPWNTPSSVGFGGHEMDADVELVNMSGRTGTGDSVDTSSGAYDNGDTAATVHSLAFGVVHLGRNAVMQAGKGIVRRGWDPIRGLVRLAWDPRRWKSVARTHSATLRRLAGEGLKDRAEHLHHWLFPQRLARWRMPEGLLNAGFNHLPISAGFNSFMNGTTSVRIAVELGFKAVVGGICAAPFVGNHDE